MELLLAKAVTVLPALWAIAVMERLVTAVALIILSVAASMVGAERLKITVEQDARVDLAVLAATDLSATSDVLMPRNAVLAVADAAHPARSVEATAVSVVHANPTQISLG